MVWDDDAHWCDTGYPRVRDIDFVRLGGTLYLADQATVALYDSLRGLALLPTEWNCRGDYCWAVNNNVHYATYRGSLLRGNSSNTGNVYIFSYDIAWRCMSTDLFPVRITDDMTPTPQDGTGVRLFNEYCLTCAQFCAPNGICANSSESVCACQDGWTGKRCRTPNVAATQVVPFQTAWPHALRFNCSTDAECIGAYFRGNNTNAAAVGCFVVVEPVHGRVVQPTQTACWCMPGFVPYAYQNDSANSSAPTFACVRAATHTLYGAVFAASTTRAALLSIVLPERTFLYVETERAIGAVYSPARVSYNDDAFRINASSLNLWRCKNHSRFFYYQDAEDASLASSRISLSYAPFDVHCLGGETACAGVALSIDARNGSCRCPPQFAGRYCGTCAGGWAGSGCRLNSTACRVANCSNHGECSAPAGCVCDRGYFGANCSVGAFACRQTRCTGNGECDAFGGCACDYGRYGNNCSEDAAQCATRRCRSHGLCFYHAYGCTCDAGFTRYANCSKPNCSALHGQLSADESRCECAAGWTGDLCETSACGVNAVYQGGCRCAWAFAQTWPSCQTSRCPRGSEPDATDAYESCVCTRGYAVDPATGLCARLCWQNGTVLYDADTDKCVCRASFQGDFCETQELIRRIPEAQRTSVPAVQVTNVTVFSVETTYPVYLDTLAATVGFVTLVVVMCVCVSVFLFFVFAHVAHAGVYRKHTWISI